MNGNNGLYDREKEIREAISAGERALASLKRAQQELDGARTWGVFDLLGGNIITGAVKHMKIGDASRFVEEARRDLTAFQDELDDVRDLQDLDIDVGGFLTFADFFWDGFLADILVQSRINDARRRIADAISRTDAVVRKLKSSL